MRGCEGIRGCDFVIGSGRMGVGDPRSRPPGGRAPPPPPPPVCTPIVFPAQSPTPCPVRGRQGRCVTARTTSYIYIYVVGYRSPVARLPPVRWPCPRRRPAAHCVCFARCTVLRHPPSPLSAPLRTPCTRCPCAAQIRRAPVRGSLSAAARCTVRRTGSTRATRLVPRGLCRTGSRFRLTRWASRRRRTPSRRCTARRAWRACATRRRWRRR